MPAVEAVGDLESRRRELLLESELNRKVLQVEFGQWQLQATRWQSRLSTVRVASLLVLPALRMFLSRKRPDNRPRSLIGTLLRLFARR